MYILYVYLCLGSLPPWHHKYSIDLWDYLKMTSMDVLFNSWFKFNTQQQT